MKRITIISAPLVAGGLALASPALADERTCTGSIGAETVDNLKVSTDATCWLDGTVVEGNIVVERGATLLANGVRVDGNVQSEGHRQVDLTNARVGGSVQLKQGGGATVSANDIDSDLQFDANGQRLVAGSNTIGGNLQAFSNRNGLDVIGNTIDGNLQCTSNEPAPTGGGNVVHGSAENQCANLRSGAQPSPSPDGSFCDVAGHTHERGIGAATGAGIAQGSGGCYRPDDAVTRGQMATFLARAEQLPSGSGGAFCDTAGHTHETSIDKVAAAGIALGANGCYRPDEPVTRGQMATFLVRAFQL